MEEDEIVMKIIFDEIYKTKTVRNSAEIDKEIKKEDKNMEKIEIGKRYRLTGDFNKHHTMYGFENDDIVKVIGEDEKRPEWKVKKIDSIVYGYCDSKCLKPFEYTFENFKKAPIGTKVFLEDGKYFVKIYDYKDEYNNCFRNDEFCRCYCDFRDMRDNFGEHGEIIRIEEPIKYESVYENKAILDKTEKKYLGDLIRPFRGKVDRIRKTKTYDEKEEAITIYMRCNENHIYLPNFKTGTMYKGMREMQDYTPEELGI